MLNEKSFKKTLQSLALTQGKFKEQAQSLALFCIEQNHKTNLNYTIDLLTVLLTKLPKQKEFKQDGKPVMRDVYKFATADASRIIDFIVHFSPVSVNSELSRVQYQKHRVLKGCVPLSDTSDYPLWHEWAKVANTGVHEAKDGLEKIAEVFANLMKSVKTGRTIITDDSRPIFDRIISGIDELVTHEAKSLTLAKQVTQEQELVQKSATKPILKPAKVEKV